MRRLCPLYAALTLLLALAGCGGAPPASGPSTLVPAASPSAPVASPPAPAASPSAPTASPPAPAASPPAPAASPSAPAASPSAPVASPSAPTASPSAPAFGAEILFLRSGVLVALDPATSGERVLADEVHSFAATRDGATIAFARSPAGGGELWVIGRDGADLRQLTANATVEAGLSWSPDGRLLAFTAGPAPAPRAPTWESWSAWCAASEARVLDVVIGGEQALGAGCEPAFSPDGRRIAFTTAPTSAGSGFPFIGAANTIAMVNAQGANGWSVASADGAGTTEGYLVYGPSWAPAGDRVVYQRFLGYQALVDINLTEISSSFERSGEPLGVGAGWLLTPLYAPDGGQVAVVEHNFSDARGFSGYDIWQLSVLRLGETQEMALPSATLTLQAATVDSLARATAAAWSPDGESLAVTLPPGWQPGLSAQEPAYSGAEAGELWRWSPGAPPGAMLAEGLDFASPVLWLPALP